MNIPATATTVELAHWLGVSRQRVQQLDRMGVVRRIDHNKYDLPASITAMCKHLRDIIERRGTADATNLTASSNLRAAKTRLLQARVAREAGELISRDDLHEGWTRIVRGTTAMITGLPDKIGAALPSLTEHDRAAIRQLCEDGLQDAGLENGFHVGGPVADDEDDEPA